MTSAGKLIKEERRQHRAAVANEVARKLDNFREALKRIGKEPAEIAEMTAKYEKLLHSGVIK